MASATTQAIWRSGGGDTTKTAYAGSMVMTADFYFLGTAVANTAVQKSATNTASVILPIGAIVTSIQTDAAITGGVSPTFDMGFTGGSERLINEGVGTTKVETNWGSTTAGTHMGTVISATALVTITGNVGASAGTGGSVSGRLFYYVPTNGSYAA